MDDHLKENCSANPNSDESFRANSISGDVLTGKNARKIQAEQYIEKLKVGGDFVGRDNITNIFGLARKQTWLLVAILIIILCSVVIAIWLILKPLNSPTLPPLVGDFKIGVSSISSGVHQIDWFLPKTDNTVGDEIYDLLAHEVQQATLDFKIGLGNPAQVGAINGTGIERIAQARQLAEAIKADLLVFGTLTPGEDESTFVPELYIDPDAFPNAEEAADYFALDPIRVEGNIYNNPVSKKELSSQLINRVKEYIYFSIGLGYLARDNYAEAGNYLQQAYELAYKLQTSQDRTAILLMLGTIANYQEDHPTAYVYYKQATEIDETYARAYLGLGQTRFLMARQKCTKNAVDRTGIQEALSHYNQALRLASGTYAEIPSKVALFSAHAYTCLAEADGKAEDWSQAQSNYESVLRNYASNKASTLLRYLAAEASGAQALVILREDIQNLPDAPADKLVDALAAFEQAAEWSRHPQRRTIFFLWQVRLHLARRDCAQAKERFTMADKARQTYLSKNPTQLDSQLEGLYTRVQADLQACVKGVS